MSESVELLGCPFCGNTPKVREPFGLVRSGYQIACYSDECFGPRTTAHELEDCIAQWNCRATPPAAPAGGEGEAVAYWVEHPKFGMELSLDPPNEDAERRGWVAKPLYLAAPAQSASGHDIEAAIERIMSIRNGMTTDMEARAIVRRELEALAALKDASR